MKSALFVVLWLNINALTLLSFIVYGTNAYHDQDADDIIVKLKPGGTMEDIDNILSKHPRFKLGRQFDLLDETYFELVLDKSSIPSNLVSGNIKPLSDDDDDVVSLKQDPKVEKCMVDYKTPVEIMNADPELVWYLTKQPDVKVSMNIDKAWRKGYTGKGVTVAVIDTQTQIDHLDLVENTDAANSINLFRPRTNQKMVDDNIFHGTAVSGVIHATRSNGFCSVGIAYNATLLAVGLLPDNSASLSMANQVSALTHNLSTVDIYTNSWADDMATGFTEVNPLLVTALQHGVTNGRQGKGSIYVFAAGNGGPESNTATSDLMSNIYTIAISSVEYDTVVSYGQLGSNIMAVGYGGSAKQKLIPCLYPIDQCSNSPGINVGSFGGTSFSAPQITGIIALALEANPELTWRDVQHLIVRSSRRYRFKDKYNPEYKWKRNGFGFVFHPKMGFGLINALKMVTMAKKWKTVPEMISCKLDWQNITRTAGNRNYLTGNLRVTRRDCSIRFLENIMVTTDVTYSAFRGYTEIELVSPKRTRSPLLTVRSYDNKPTDSPGTFVWTFRTVHFWGENTIGNWKLRTRSASNLCKVGPVSWSVTFYGTAKRVVNNIN